MYIPQMLPLLKGWKYTLLDFNSQTANAAFLSVPPGQKYDLFSRRGPGWVINGSLLTTHYYGRLVTELDNTTLGFSPFDLTSSGVLEPDGGFWETTYERVVITGRKTVAVAGTPEPLAAVATLVPKDVKTTIHALGSNTGNVYFSYTSAAAQAAATRSTLAPGVSTDVASTNLNHLWLNVDVSGEGVEFTYEAPDTINTTTAGFFIGYLPPYPYPFGKNGRVYVENPAQLPTLAGGGRNTQTLYIQQYQVAMIEITDELAFRESIKDVLGTLPVPLAAMMSSEVASRGAR